MRKQHVMEPTDDKLRKIALHQMCSGINIEDNLKVMKRAIKAAAAEGACFYFAPEMSCLLDRNRERAAGALFIESETAAIAEICRSAAEAGIWVHLGSVAVRLDDRPNMLANRTLLIDDKGQICARYDKMHLFDVDLDSGESWRESSAYAPGRGPTLADTLLGPMGLTICYDMRFPDLYSTLSKAGARIFAVPAAFTQPTGQAHWHIMLRARAIESASFVVAAAQSGGHDDGRETYGHSLVVDPWGAILGFVEIDLSQVDHVRKQIPVHLNRREIPDQISRF
jgi:deaminated glutathione amidase